MKNRISKGFEYQELTQDEASKLLYSGFNSGKYEPRGSFVVKEGNGYTAIDNRDGHAWTEYYKSISGAVAYLKSR